jgi:hypothetical protein
MTGLLAIFMMCMVDREWTLSFRVSIEWWLDMRKIKQWSKGIVEEGRFENS